jgi:hypothetical protein
MAELTKLESLAKLLEGYGIGVRAGVITPCEEDEIAFRAMMDLPEMSARVKEDWNKSSGVRRPITLSGSVLPSDTGEASANEGAKDAGKEEGKDE